jgi:signal transduction histidine kinase
VTTIVSESQRADELGRAARRSDARDGPAGPYQEILAELAHDLEKPLAVIRAHAPLLDRTLERSDGLDAAELRRDLVRIQAASARLMLLLDDLVDAGAEAAGGVPALAPRPTDLVRLAREVAARHQRATDRHLLRVESAADAIAGVWDPGRLERALSNLVSNAIKFSPDGGDVVLTLWRSRDGVVLSVRDRGLGIPADDLERVFDRFHRAANVVGRIAGTGLGLPIVRRIAEQHGGRTYVAWSGTGDGTEVVLRLPLGPVAKDVAGAASQHAAIDRAGARGA